MKKKMVLCILDGCGLREESDGNAFKNAHKKNFDYLVENYPHTILNASGPFVGLPYGQMGTSEVGHMNIGAGRIALQPLEAINTSIRNNQLIKNNELLNLINHVKTNNSNLHIMGLLSDGGIHSHINHLLSILDICKEYNLKNIYIDVFTDGRDTYEKSAKKYLKILTKKLNEVGGKISTISGRYYAMDRDNNYDRLKLAYDAICKSVGEKYTDFEKLLQTSYRNGKTDEFIEPAIINSCPLKDGDGVLTFNFRKDRLRELFTLLSNPNEYKEEAQKQNLNIINYNNLYTVTMFPVTNTVKSHHIFNDQNLKNILGEYLHKNNYSQLRIAETEKYPHVTFFFDGGKEIMYDDMKKVLIPSPKVATYDLKPEMSVYEVTDAFLKEVNNYDVTIMNLANGDMVGHTGVYNAAVKAVECMDECLGKIYNKVVKELDGTLIIIADHGNCDVMWDENHNPVTSHTTNPVPCIITKKGLSLKEGKLADVAPTMLKLLGLEIPEEMTGEVLITN